MNRKVTTRLVREGEYLAEVEVKLVKAEGNWTPHIALEDANRMDDVREALRAGDISRASGLAKCVYRLSPVQV